MNPVAGIGASQESQDAYATKDCLSRRSRFGERTPYLGRWIDTKTVNY